MPRPWSTSRLGKPNKRTTAKQLAVQELCEKYHLDPLEAMIQMAKDPTLDDPHLRFLLLKEITQYVRPKLRVVQLQGDPDHPMFNVNVNIKTSLSEAFALAYGTAVVPANGQPIPLPVGRP